MITVESWSKAVAFGSVGVVAFTLSAARPVTAVTVDLLGDGLAAPTVVRGDDLRDVVALRFQPAKRGQFEVQIRAVDAAGCEAATGVRRDVEVR